MDIQDILNLLAEFDGNNHQALAKKYRVSLTAVYQIIKRAVGAVGTLDKLKQQTAETEAKFTRGATLLQLFSQFQDLGYLTFRPLLPAESTHRGLAVFFSHSQALPTDRLSSQPVSQSRPEQAQDSPDSSHPSEPDVSSALQPRPVNQKCDCSGTHKPDQTSMSPFTLLLGRLTELLGAEIAAKLVHDFQGAIVQFPITSHYTAPCTNTHIVRRVSVRMSVTLDGKEYDVSHLPKAMVGDLISIKPSELRPLQTFGFHANVEAPLQAKTHDDETSQAVSDQPNQLHDHVQPLACRAYATRLHQCVSALEAAANLIRRVFQVLPPKRGTQSKGHPSDPASLD